MYTDVSHSGPVMTGSLTGRLPVSGSQRSRPAMEAMQSHD